MKNNYQKEPALYTSIGEVIVKWNFQDGPAPDLFLERLEKFILKTSEKIHFTVNVSYKNYTGDRNQLTGCYFRTNFYELTKTGDKIVYCIPDVVNPINVAFIDLPNKVAEVYFPFEAGTFLTYNFSLLLHSHIFMDHSAFILHSSAMLKDDKVIIYSGPSGSGKSTIANRMTDCLVMNDDKIVVRLEENWVFAYGSPWHGEIPEVYNKSGKLETIYFLEIKTESIFKERKFKKINKSVAFAQLIKNVYKIPDPESNQQMNKYFNLFNKILSYIDFLAESN